MPRRPPGSLRPAHDYPPAPIRRIPKVSQLTRATVRRVEREHGRPNMVADAIVMLRLFLRQRYRWLRPNLCQSCPGCDPRFQFDSLAEIWDALPAAAQTDLLRVLGPLIDDYARRTVPLLPTYELDDRWWYRRALDDEHVL